ncbi:isoaspartyl peptidase/L-asparaginase family protein [Rudaea cellulosilytica]|uniref:isoaspartyl peptidase/L-asparaginase family protein n=1 Tax=Rudaea cellulosilytica TaxID=540746 RepID=UPI000364A9ED|nr:isoaspartyl peptidase/L-asparaginase [Rudaea cellulosilytica]
MPHLPRRFLASLLLSLGAVSMTHAATPVLVIHGGAGVVRKEMTPEKEKAVRAGLEKALQAGYSALKSGASSLDAVTRAIVVLEDDPNFNAGKGAVFNHDGRNELDASIMDGATLRAGAVANVHRIKNPIELARAVMEKSEHVMLIEEGAEKFAKSIGMHLVDPKYFYTEERWKALQQALDEEKAKTAEPGKTPHHGTVGAVALDSKGNLAAGTSTGGMTNKRFGRVGDSPIIGAGTYADARCAVSATGWGEYYIRATAARDICARVEFRGDELKKAADEVVLGVIPKLGGDGGVIALDKDGNIAMPFNTDGMFRGWVDRDGKTHVAIYAGE